MNTTADLWARWKVWLLSVAAGALLGCIYRLLFSWKNPSDGLQVASWIMTLAFLVFVPLAMGYLSVHRYLQFSTPENVRWYKWIFLPWASVLIAMLVSVAVKWEGVICTIFAGPIMLVCSLLGGIAARLIWGQFKRRSPGTISAFALPLLLLAVEAHIPALNEVRTVETDVLIHAPAAVV
jgi:hypothetical protein